MTLDDAIPMMEAGMSLEDIEKVAKEKNPEAVEKSAELGPDDAEARSRFSADMDELRLDLEGRFRSHLLDGQPVAAMEARLLARLIETRNFTAAKVWAGEYQGSLDRDL